MRLGLKKSESAGNLLFISLQMPDGNPIPLTITGSEQGRTNTVSHDPFGLALMPFAATQAAPVAIEPGHDWDAGEENFMPSILPLLQAAIWEVWADTLELIAMDPGWCDGKTSLFHESLQRPGARWLDRVCPLDLPEVKAFFALDESDLARRSIDYRVILDRGDLLWVRHWLLRPLTAIDGRIRLSGLIMAIPEQKRLERECLLAGENERNRIGQELHDDVCQELAGLSYMMEGLAGRLTKKAPELSGELDELKAEVTAVMTRTRSMAHGLFSARLNHASLQGALRELARQIKARFGLAIQLDLPRRLPRHNPEQVIHIYRIVQEAVGNSIRHGRATGIRIILRIPAKNVELRLEDNGSGFSTSKSRAEGVGLQSMEYRARILGGSLDFGNRKPAGAFVQLKYPLVADGCPCPQLQFCHENKNLPG
jgi:signal transduction histidine kinase